VIKSIYILIISILFSQQFLWEDNGSALRQGVHIEWQKTGDIGNAGEMIFAWSDTRSSDREIYAQKFNSSGEKLWGEDGTLIATYEGRQEDPILIHDGNGGAYIIWRDYRVEPDPIGDVYAQHINSDGIISYPADGFALSNQAGYQVSLNMCSDGQGGAYAIWRDTDGKTYASHLTPDSSQISNPGIGTVVLDHSWVYSSISLETAGGGDAMMVWFDERPEGGDSNEFVQDIYAQRIGLDSNNDIVTRWAGADVQAGGIPICTADGKQDGAKVTYYNEDWNVVVWEDSRHNDLLSSLPGSPTTVDIYAQFININGNKADAYYENGNPLVSNLCYDPTSCTPPQFGDYSDQTNPRVKASDSGAFVIWIDKRNYNDDIYMQIITPESSGVLSGSSSYPFDGVPVVEAPNTQGSARLTADGFGGAYIVWDDLQNTHTDLYIQHYNSSGSASFDAGGLVLSNASNDQLSPLVRSDQSGGALVVWEDRKDGSISLYAQHIWALTGATLDANGISMYYGVDGNAFFYNDEDLYAQKSKSLYSNNQNLVYWEDRRGGYTYYDGTPFATYYTYGSLVDASGPSDASGSQLSTYFDQKYPSVDISGNNYFLSFAGKDVGSGDRMMQYQMLDQDFNFNDTGEGIFIDSELFTSQGKNRAYATVVDNSNNLYIIYSKLVNGLNQIFLQKIDSSGQISGSEDNPIALYNESDNYSTLTVKDAYISDAEDIIVIFEKLDVTNQLTINAIAFNLNYELLDSSATVLSSSSSSQNFRDAVQTNDGVFIVWDENNDIFGQHIDFSLGVMGGASGIAICSDSAEQSNPSIDYLASLNQVMACWDDRRNSDRDIYCASITLASNAVNEIPITENKSQAQVNPYVKSTLTDSYLVAWEESALYSSGDVFTGDPVYYYDISMQEIKSDQVVYNQDVTVCNAFHNQVNPRIDILTESLDVSYLIYWEDMRSSGKEDLTNLFSQQLKIQDCSGSLGGSQGFNVGACDCSGNTLDQCGVCGGSDSTCAGCMDVLACNYDSNALFSDESCVYAEEGYDCTGNSLDIDKAIPDEYQLYDNYPNPFNPATIISFDVPKNDFVELNIYNIKGQKVKTLESNYFIPGNYSIEWNGRNDRGEQLPSGIYFYSLVSSDFNKKNKMLLIK